MFFGTVFKGGWVLKKETLACELMEWGWLADCAPGRFRKITGTKAPIAAGVSSYFKQEIQQNLSYTPPREAGGGGTLKELRLGNRWRKAQSKKLTRGPPTPRDSSAHSFRGGVHIGARALHVLNLIWFG
jgi:hypothetical protein